MSISHRRNFSNIVPRSRNEFGRRKDRQLPQFAPNDHPTPGAMLGPLSGLKFPLPGYYRHRPLEIFSHNNYNTASAQIIEQVLC